MKAYCINCGLLIEDDETSCSSCGCKSLILGENNIDYVIDEKNNKIKCICGNESFLLVKYMSLEKIHKQVYECKECNKNITIDVETSKENI